MTSMPPPPPGSEPPPPSEDLSHIPPPSGEEHVNDVLERKKKISWKNFGGDGFLVSVAFHVLLAIIALFYIVSKYNEPKKNTDPEVFATGAGGGRSGDRAKIFDQPKTTRQVNVKMPARIMSKGASSIVLPDTPQTSMASFASGLTSGGMSKGSGGGSGGGEGTGLGIGKGGGRNFVSLFGARGAGAIGLPGVLYDAKQTSEGKSTRYSADSSLPAYVQEVLRPLVRHWSTTRLEKFFKSSEALVASQIMIPYMSADAAPAAYGVADKVKAKRWFAWYHGTVRAPKSGKFRFWGAADDVLYVRFNGKPALDAGYTLLSVGAGAEAKVSRDHSVLGSKDTKPTAHSYAVLRAGPWFEVRAGEKCPVDIVISELPGGVFWAYLLMEEAGDTKTPLFLFRMSDDPPPDGMRDATGLNVDMTGKGLVWRAEKTRSLVR